MKRKAVVWLAVAAVLITVVATAHQWGKNKPKSDMEIVAGIEKSLAGEYKKQAETELIKVSSYVDEYGNEINYYILKTVVYDEAEEITPFETVIGGAKVNYCREIKVQDKTGRIYGLDHRAYLCWELSDGICGVLEYDPETVSDGEMKRMAESILPSGD